MAILGSVGHKGKNDKVDVKVIQAALNLAQSKEFKLENRLLVDGKIGKKTIAAIGVFQNDMVKLSSADGRVDAGGKTLKKIRQKIKPGLEKDSLLAIMARGREATIQFYLLLMKAAFPGYQINTPLRTAHLLAQIGHESMSLLYTEEIASGAAYEGRKDLGNVEKGDGMRFKGRGLIQLTGRNNYQSYGKYLSVDFLKKGNEQMIATTPKYALDVSL